MQLVGHLYIPKYPSFLQTLFSIYFAFSLIQYAHILMSHIVAARPIMTSCAEFIIRWTSLFLSSLGTFYCVQSDSFAVGVVPLCEDECTSVTYLNYKTHTLMSLLRFIF